MNSTGLPIACSLSDSAFRTRRSELVQRIVPAVTETQELDNGFAFSFPASDEWLHKLTEFVIIERRCCPFLNFKIIIESNHDSVVLELTGQEGVKEFIASLLN